MRTDDDRRVPIPAVGDVISGGLRLDPDPLPRAPIKAGQIPILILSVNRVRIFRVDYGAKAVAALSDEPIFIWDTVDLQSARRSTEALIVLGTTVYVVKRF